MKHLPLFFDLSGRKVVVVGEGPAADRRAELAGSAGAKIQRIASSAVEASDFRGAAAAFIATGDADRDAAAQRLARSAGVPVNVADRPSLCDFILPAIVDRDEVVVAISTGGASPTLATVLRGRIEAALPERIGAVARLAATFRAQVNALIGEPNRRRASGVVWSKGRRGAWRWPATMPARAAARLVSSMPRGGEWRPSASPISSALAPAIPIC